MIAMHSYIDDRDIAFMLPFYHIEMVQAVKHKGIAAEYIVSECFDIKMSRHDIQHGK
jgi:hypothetical protein